MKALVLGADKGARLHTLTEDKPKEWWGLWTNPCSRNVSIS